MKHGETRARPDIGTGRRMAFWLACAAPLALAMPAAASAQGETATQDFSIPAGPLSQALQAYSAATGVQLVYSSELVQGLGSPGASGRLTRAEALSRLLAGTGLSGSLSGNTATITGAGAPGERVTGAVRVEGTQGSPYFGGAGVAAGVNGINGSRDITATEGTGSFTSGALTIGSKVPQALKDVPQSISVLTNERLEQQNVTDFDAAMKQLPGVSFAQGGSNLQTTFYSRGFEVTSIQIDGGAPLTTRIEGGYPGLIPQIDMSIYDHVELLRGAAGLFNGYGDPGGTVNLVRKKPLDHGQYTLELQAGSWSDYRVVADASSPLALDGKLRGRLVTTYQNKRFFYDTASDRKTLIYGIAELDLTPTTLVTAGVNYTEQHSVPWIYGLPRYINGDDLELPRSTCLCVPWNRWDFDTTEIFGGVEQQLGGEWIARINLTKSNQSSTSKAGFVMGGVDMDDFTGPRFDATYSDYKSDQFSVEGMLSGAFDIFGQRQEIALGLNRVSSDAGDQKIYLPLIYYFADAPYQPYPGSPSYYEDGPNGLTPPADVIHFDPNNPLYNEPKNTLPSQYYAINRQVQWVGYLNLRLTAFDRLHLTTGLRWSRFEGDQIYQQLCTRTTGSCAGKQIGDVRSTSPISASQNNFSWPPSVTASYDFTNSLTAYVGYTDIYQNQSRYVNSDLSPIAPVTGGNWEGGVKWAPGNGSLNLSLAAYRIHQKGFRERDGTIDYTTGEAVASDGTRVPNYGNLGNGVSCCWKSQPEYTLTSEGLDFEANGQIMAGWQMSASLTYNTTRFEGAVFGSSEGEPFITITPKFLYKLWTSYDFGAAGASGALSGLTLAAGVNGQSSGFRSGSVCTTEFYSPYPEYPSYETCKTPQEPYSFTVPPYAVVSARIDYRFSDHWSLAVNLENILDKTYYESVGQDPRFGHWYGAPRSFTATLKAKW